MTDMEILQIADQCGVVAVTKHEWDGKQFNHTDDYLDGDGAALVIFAKLVAEHEREACAQIADRLPRIYQETKDAHERLSMEPFKPSNFGFDLAVLQQAEKITHSIRARGDNK